MYNLIELHSISWKHAETSFGFDSVPQSACLSVRGFAARRRPEASLGGLVSPPPPNQLVNLLLIMSCGHE